MACLSLSGQCSIPQCHVVLIAAIRGIRIRSVRITTWRRCLRHTGHSRHCGHCGHYGHALRSTTLLKLSKGRLLRLRIPVTTETAVVTAATASSGLAVTLLLSTVSTKRYCEAEMTTYHCVDLLPDSALRVLDGSTRTYQTNISFDIRALRLVNIDLATSDILHLLNGLASFANDHTDGFGRHLDGFCNLAIVTTITPTTSVGVMSTSTSTVSAPSGVTLWWCLVVSSGVAFHNFRNHCSCSVGRCLAANQVHRPLSVHALVFAYDVDVTTALFLKISDSFTTTSNDKADGLVWYPDLDTVLTLAQCWLALLLLLLWCACSSAPVVRWCTAVFFNNPKDLTLGSVASTHWTGDGALTVWSVRFLGWDELYARTCLRFYPPEVLSCTADNQTD